MATTYTYRADIGIDGKPIVVVEAGDASALAVVNPDGTYEYQPDDCDANPADDAGWPEIPSSVIAQAMGGWGKAITKIEVVWDDDHGIENEGWYTRTTYSDGQQEDRPVDDSADATDADLIERYSDGNVTAKVVR